MGDKTRLIEMLRDEFKRWEELMAGMRDEQISAPHFMDELSVKDVVAHLTTWQQISVERLQAARQNRQPEYPAWHPEFDPDTDEELDQMNAWIYETCREKPWMDIHREWRERFLLFLKLAKATPENDLLEIGKYRWLKEYPLSAVLLGSYEHHEEHLESVLALLYPGEEG